MGTITLNDNLYTVDGEGYTKESVQSCTVGRKTFFCPAGLVLCRGPSRWGEVNIAVPFFLHGIMYMNFSSTREPPNLLQVNRRILTAFRQIESSFGIKYGNPELLPAANGHPLIWNYEYFSNR
jgi:hypothetical protein